VHVKAEKSAKKVLLIFSERLYLATESSYFLFAHLKSEQKIAKAKNAKRKIGICQ
jgi:hypothetical protein